MRLFLGYGESVHIGFMDGNGQPEEGEILVNFSDRGIEVHSDFLDSIGRGGHIYDAIGEDANMMKFNGEDEKTLVDVSFLINVDLPNGGVKQFTDYQEMMLFLTENNYAMVDMTDRPQEVGDDEDDEDGPDEPDDPEPFDVMATIDPDFSDTFSEHGHKLREPPVEDNVIVGCDVIVLDYEDHVISKGTVIDIDELDNDCYLIRWNDNDGKERDREFINDFKTKYKKNDKGAWELKKRVGRVWAGVSTT